MNYTKDFEAWLRVKLSVQSRPSSSLGYKEREIWWAQLGVNIGDEEDGKGAYYSRPVLIVKGFSKNLMWVVPLTSAQRSGKYYYSFELNGANSAAILSQLRALDRRRLTAKLGAIEEKSFRELKQKLTELML